MVAIVAVLPGLLAAQAITEGILVSAKSAATTAPAADAAGKAIGGVFDKLGRALSDATTTQPAAAPAPARSASRPAATRAAAPKSTVASRRPAPAEPTAPAVTYEDPAGIKEGMEYAEVMKRFGPPAMKFTSGMGDELLSYANNTQGFDVKMRNGKVAGIQKIGGSDPEPAAK
jgi:hypothetical protein